mmetsp:Transcript_82433/g.150886  ORF Transcript_82433/g.150886 Transcript_82433/m.150886 type:complete len:147 (+) Transcript_82433:33-473(+)
MRLNIEDNLKSEKISDKVCINRWALSDHEGKAQFGFGMGGGMTGGYGGEPVEVNVTTLDAFFAQYIDPKKKVLLVKLDVQGEELKVLRGARELLKGCRVKNWVIGVHEGVSSHKVANILKRNGYQIVSLVRKSGPKQLDDEVVARC